MRWVAQQIAIHGGNGNMESLNTDSSQRETDLDVTPTAGQEPTENPVETNPTNTGIPVPTFSGWSGF